MLTNRHAGKISTEVYMNVIFRTQLWHKELQLYGLLVSIRLHLAADNLQMLSQWG